MERKDSNAKFPQTRWSVVLRAAGGGVGGDNALGELFQTYWFPLYSFARRSGHSAADAEDLVQNFLSKAVETHLFAKADIEKGKLRTFLLTTFRRFARDEYEKANAQKRGGGNVISFDAVEAENWYDRDQIEGETPEKMYDRQWAVTVLENAVKRLEGQWAQKGKNKEFEGLRPFLTGTGDSADYEKIGREIGMKPDTVKVTIHRMRAKFSVALREEVQDTHADDSDVDEELRYLIQLL